MPRLLIALALAVLSAPGLGAQTGLYAHLGFERTGFAPEALDVFTDTYNAYYSQRIVTPFEYADATVTRPVFGATFRYAAGLYAALGYQYGRTTQQRQADLGGLAQQVELRVFDHNVHVEMGFTVGPVYVAGLATGLFRGEVLTAETVYPDGSVSIGNEVLPNGYYTGSTPDLGFGVAAGFLAGRLAVPVRIVFPSKFLGSFDQPVTDYDRQAFRTYFPGDWVRYLEDDSGFDEASGLQVGDFYTPHFSIGLEFRLL